MRRDLPWNLQNLAYGSQIRSIWSSQIRSGLDRHPELHLTLDSIWARPGSIRISEAWSRSGLDRHLGLHRTPPPRFPPAPTIAWYSFFILLFFDTLLRPSRINQTLIRTFAPPGYRPHAAHTDIIDGKALLPGHRWHSIPNCRIHVFVLAIPRC